MPCFAGLFGRDIVCFYVFDSWDAGFIAKIDELFLVASKRIIVSKLLF